MIIKDAEEKFIAYLGDKDLKYTPQRKTILAEALRAKGHFSAEELLDIAKKKDKSISKATLYRTLSLLKDSDILEEHDFGSGYKSYEPRIGHSHHDHIVCIKCRKIYEFENQAIEELQEKEARKRGVKLIFHTHKLFGLCKDCAK